MNKPLMSAENALDAVLNDASSIASEHYLNLWNTEVQAKIDEDIERHRKADAHVTLDGVEPGTEVQVKQITHQFRFGANIFNYDQLGSDEQNACYKDVFGTLLNTATIPFYWKTLEPEEGRVRFAPGYEDSAEYWNTVKKPKYEPHWRRPAPDPIVDFCESKGLHLHGHTFVWGHHRWQQPLWMKDKLPQPYRDMVQEKDGNMPLEAPVFDDLSAEQLEELMPEFTAEYNAVTARRIIEIALRYKSRIHSWDVVNESAKDFGLGVQTPHAGLCKCWYGLMPGDYTYRSYKFAESVLPPDVKLYINDYLLNEEYVHQVQDLRSRGCRIDSMGIQVHLFNPQTCQDIVEGKSDHVSPDDVWQTMDLLDQAEVPLHLSEITIASPTDDERGHLIQALIARNLLRQWFSISANTGITWWNVVDDCGAPGEPLVSGLFTREMLPKAAFHIVNDLINNEWKTHIEVTAGQNGAVGFRGFRGRYQLSWKDRQGVEQTVPFDLV